MKKLIVLAMALAVSMGVASVVLAASDTAQVTIHVTVTSGINDITRISSADFTIGWGPMLSAASNTTVADNDHRMIFKNTGTTRQNWAVQVATFPGWSYVTDGNPGAVMTVADQVRLSAVFAQYGLSYTVSDFNTADIISNTIKWSSSTALAVDGQPDAGNKGIGVYANDERGLYVSFDTPTAASTNLGRELTATLTVTAGVF